MRGLDEPASDAGAADGCPASGDVLPETFPRTLSDGPLRSPQQYPGVHGQVSHSERLLIGYRWYAAKHVTPLFPFGFGLSYTTFRFSRLVVHPMRSEILVRFTVTNTGQRTGADVAQVYVGDPPAAGEPPEQLAGFARVVLTPHQSVTVTLDVAQRSLAYWRAATGRWTVAPGCYSVMAGDSSASLMLRAKVGRGRHSRRCRG